MNRITSPVVGNPAFVPDRFDNCRSDRMLVGSVLRYARNLFQTGNPDLLEKRAESAVREIEEAIQAMDRVALICIKAEVAAVSAGEFDEPKPNLRTLLDNGPDYELTDLFGIEDGPTPLEILAFDLALPPISGGAPVFEPSPEDWSDYESAFLDHIDEINQGIELDPTYLTEQDVIRVTGCC